MYAWDVYLSSYACRNNNFYLNLKFCVFEKKVAY